MAAALLAGGAWRGDLVDEEFKAAVRRETKRQAVLSRRWRMHTHLVQRLDVCLPRRSERKKNKGN